MILNYLHKNPDAGDTLEGITRWWLESESISISVNDVESAVESLVERGIVSRKEIGNSNFVYKIC